MVYCLKKKKLMCDILNSCCGNFLLQILTGWDLIVVVTIIYEYILLKDAVYRLSRDQAE